MAENFYTMLTKIGRSKLSNSAVSGSKVNFKTLKVGDGKGAYYEPSENQTSILNEVWSGNISSILVDEANSNWIITETIIPATDGGFFIREAGIFDEVGDMIAVSKLSETYKPVVSEGSTKDLCIKIILEVSNVDSVSLKIDPNVVVASKSDLMVLESKIGAQLSDIKNDISNGAVTTPTVSYGMNSVIKNTGKRSVSPRFTMIGKTVINLFGKDGNCEDVSKWGAYQATSALDSTNKVFGANGIKITLTNTSGSLSKVVSTFNLDTTKYYLVSAYIKNGNASNGAYLIKDNTGGGTPVQSPVIVDATKFNRVGMVIQPSYLNASNYIGVNVLGTSGQYVYVDGIMINEITSAEYALGATALLDKYPYVDSYACLKNPYIEVIHDNLVRNGNGEEGVDYWKAYDTVSSISKDTVGFKIISTSGVGFVGQTRKVKPNTNHYFSGNITNGSAIGTLMVVTTDGNTIIKSNTGLFNSGSYDEVLIYLKISTTGYVNFDSIMLVEGTTAPTQYLPCRIERTVIETKLTSDDSIIYENGKVTGLRNWKHPSSLFGKDYDWQFSGDLTGGKNMFVEGFNDGIPFMEKVVKYDGNILAHQDVFDTNSKDVSCLNPVGRVFFALKDTDTGFAELINPNNEELKAFMNGWKAIGNSGTRYVAWWNITDTSNPQFSITGFPNNNATKLTVATSSITSITVENASIFNVSDWISVFGDSFRQISSISGNVITLSTSVPTGFGIGNVVSRLDNSTTDLRNLNFCKSNVAPNYGGYQLHYKLKNPEPIMDNNFHIHGDIPKLDVGDNYLYLDSGIVLGEVANPLIAVDGGAYRINDSWVTGSYVSLKYRTESISSIYKNQISIPFTQYIGASSSYGKAMAIIDKLNYDTSSQYTVDYKILATQAPQIGSIGCSYTQDIVTAINKLEEVANNKQNHDSALDNIVDLSVYEIIPQVRTHQWFMGSGVVYLDFFLKITTKKVYPIISIGNMIPYINNIVSTTFGLNTLNYKLSNNEILVRYASTDTTTIANIKTYGIEGILYNVIVDCRGRI